jgi:hypothetical protein
MIKRTLIALILAVSILAFSVPASATSYFSLDDLVYEISGKMTVKIDIRDYATLSVTLPKLDNFDELFIFYSDGTFMDNLMYNMSDSDYTTGLYYPTWSQSGINFTVDLSDLAYSIESELGSYVDISGGATKSPVITGKISNNGNSISGKMNLGWNISTYVPDLDQTINGSITISMTYKGIYYGYVEYYSALKASEGRTAFKKAVKEAIVNVLSSLPKKAKQASQQSK